MPYILPRFRCLISYSLLYVIAFNSIVILYGSLSTVQAQRRRIIVINAEQPNLWTLEQAHYLLAQMHRRNLDLKTKSLGDLDPNEIAGLRFDVMRMLIEFGATFNQADLATNRLLSENRTFNAERRQELTTERDSLRREALRLTGEIEELENEKAGTEDEDEKKRIDARIAAKNTRLARVDKESELLNEELKTLTAPSGDPKATTGGATFSPEKLPKSTFDEAFEDAAKKQIEKFNASPQLNASLRLDNFLQMQYEIISKQLSLLRDELGPGERLVFLELPQTVNAAHHESENKWAQSWWRIAGYTHRVPASPSPTPTPIPRLRDAYRPITTSEDLNSILNQSTIPLPLYPCESHELQTYSNPEPLLIGKSSSVNVPTSGRVTQVTVTLNGFDHERPEDVDLLLVGPRGQNALILSDVGGAVPARDLTITLDDSATNDPLSVSRLRPGTHPPLNADGNVDPFPAPAPTALGDTELSVFNHTEARGKWTLYTVDDDGEATGKITRGWTLRISTECDSAPQEMTHFRNEFVNLDAPLPPRLHNASPNDDAVVAITNRGAHYENRSVRTVELIPRQSSLNVNDMNLQVRAGAFNFVLSTLFGFGSQLNVQRQREQFTQFVQQELYSAAFGKGAREFGWTFTPMPGMDRLQSGVRTTYAVVVVPDDATSLVMEANGCYFPRSSYQPSDFDDTKTDRWNKPDRTSRNCGYDDAFRSKAFVVPIPAARLEGGNEFWVDRINFTPVEAGKQVVVSLTGKNFSPQTGVLIDGIPLLHSIGLAQPLLRDDSLAGREASKELSSAGIHGTIERVDTEKIVLTFTMPPDYKGTPAITLIAPGRASTVNDLPLNIRGIPNIRLDEFPTKMFGQTPDPDPFRIDRVKVFRASATSLTALISGAGFGTTPTKLQVFVNGQKIDPARPPRLELPSDKLMRLMFDVPEDPSIRVTIVSEDADAKKRKTIESEPVANPSFLSVSDVDVLVYEAATEEEPAMVVVKITGTGFTDDLTTSIGEIAVKSATEAILTIPNPKAAAVVTLTDQVTHRSVKVVVTRKSKPPGRP